MTAVSFLSLVAFASGQSDMLDPETENPEIHWLAAVICVNMAACILLLFALAVVRLVFGELRAQELNAAKDKFWNFVFYKVNKFIKFSAFNTRISVHFRFWGHKCPTSSRSNGVGGLVCHSCFSRCDDENQ